MRVCRVSCSRSEGIGGRRAGMGGRGGMERRDVADGGDEAMRERIVRFRSCRRGFVSNFGFDHLGARAEDAAGKERLLTRASASMSKRNGSAPKLTRTDSFGVRRPTVG
jgi:hypothetical protein